MHPGVCEWGMVGGGPFGVANTQMCAPKPGGELATLIEAGRRCALFLSLARSRQSVLALAIMAPRVLLWTLVASCEAYSLLATPRLTTPRRHMMSLDGVSDDEFRFGDPHNSGQPLVGLPGTPPGGVFQAARSSNPSTKRLLYRTTTDDFRHGTGKIEQVYYGCKVIAVEEQEVAPQINPAAKAPQLAPAQKGKAKKRQQKAEAPAASAALTPTPNSANASSSKSPPKAAKAPMTVVQSAQQQDSAKTYSQRAHPSAEEANAFRFGDPHNTGQPVVGLPEGDRGGILMAARARAAAAPNWQTLVSADEFRHGRGRVQQALPATTSQEAPLEPQAALSATQQAATAETALSKPEPKASERDAVQVVKNRWLPSAEEAMAFRDGDPHNKGCSAVRLP